MFDVHWWRSKQPSLSAHLQAFIWSAPLVQACLQPGCDVRNRRGGGWAVEKSGQCHIWNQGLFPSTSCQAAALDTVADAWRRSMETAIFTASFQSCCAFVPIPKAAHQIAAVTGYLQNPRYFSPENDFLIRKEFAFLPAVQEQVRRMDA